MPLYDHRGRRDHLAEYKQRLIRATELGKDNIKSKATQEYARCYQRALRRLSKLDEEQKMLFDMLLQEELAKERGETVES